MGLWLVLIFSVLLISWLITYQRLSGSAKSALIFTVTFILVYFATFRDGLGTDYPFYVYRLLSAPIIQGPFLLTEPLFNLLAQFVRDTSLSYVFYFLFMSTLTIVPTILTYKKFDNFFIIMLVYLLVPILYSGTFNIVRQAAAAGIFLFSIRYIVDKDFLKYSICIFLAFLVHKSAFILLPLYFVGVNRLDYKYLVILLFSFSNKYLVDVIHRFSSFLELISYDRYLDYTSSVVEGVSTTQILFHIFLIPIYLLRDKIKNKSMGKYYVVSVKMYIFYLFFMNFASTGLPISYRISFYFAPFIPIIVNLLIELFAKKKNKIVMTYCLSSLFVLLGFFYFYIHFDNPTVVPKTILPINSIVD